MSHGIFKLELRIVDFCLWFLVAVTVNIDASDNSFDSSHIVCGGSVLIRCETFLELKKLLLLKRAKKNAGLQNGYV